MKDNNMNQEFINKKTLCDRLSLSPKTIQKEIQNAIEKGSDAVFMIGNTYRINFNGFINFLKITSKEKQCQKKQKTSTKGGKSTGSTTQEMVNNSSSQLRKRIYKKQ